MLEDPDTLGLVVLLAVVIAVITWAKVRRRAAERENAAAVREGLASPEEAVK